LCETKIELQDSGENGILARFFRGEERSEGLDNEKQEDEPEMEANGAEPGAGEAEFSDPPEDQKPRDTRGEAFRGGG